MNKIRVQQDDFDLSDEVAQVKNNNTDIGAVVSFVGTVRDLDDSPIEKMTLEHYPGMTEKALEEIAQQAQNRWPLGDVSIIHRVGDLAINEQIVLVIAASKHRKAAFEACEFIMDYLKTQAPFWKKEHTTTGNHWVEAKDSDTDQAKRWS